MYQDNILRLYAIVREDLNMLKGKCSAQAGHAFLNAFLEAQNQNPNIIQEYQPDGLGTKVVLAAHDLDDLMFTYYQAKDLGLPHSLIIDSEHIMPPHFDGNPIVTALGIGPCTRQQLNNILKRFKSL